jgi:hypothetical protein
VCDEASGTKGVISAVDFVAVLLFRGRGELRPFEFKQVSPREILANRTGRAILFLRDQGHAVGWSCAENSLADPFQRTMHTRRKVCAEIIANPDELVQRLKMEGVDQKVWMLYL